MRFLVLFLWIVTGIVTGVVASDKGHGFGSWLFVGLFLGPLGLIAAAGLSDQKLREYLRRTIEPQSVNSTVSTQTLFDSKALYVDNSSSVKLLRQSDVENNKQESSKEKYICDFLLNKSASEDQLWTKIIEMLDFCKPDIVSLIDRKKSNMNISLTGGRAYMICKSDGEKIALAYSKDSSDGDNFYWQLRMY